MKKDHKYLKRIPWYLLIGVVFFVGLSLFAQQFISVHNDSRSEIVAFYFGPIATIGKIFYVLLKNCTGMDIYRLFAGPWGLDLSNGGLLWFFQQPQTYIGIIWTAFLAFLIDVIPLEGKYNSYAKKIPLLLLALFLSLFVIYWLNGDFVVVCVP